MSNKADTTSDPGVEVEAPVVSGSLPNTLTANRPKKHTTPPPPCWNGAAVCEHVHCGFFPDCACGDDMDCLHK